MSLSVMLPCRGGLAAYFSFISWVIGQMLGADGQQGCATCVSPLAHQPPHHSHAPKVYFFLVFFFIFFSLVGEGRIINEFGAVTMGTCC